jgi:desulfoferrodoxin (superoxide reductase-like protein)
MKMKKLTLVIGCCLFLFCLYSGFVYANKSAVSLEGLSNTERGSEVVIKITVTHSANSFMHYTKWLKVQANGKLIQQWDYTSGNRPEGATFTKEVKIKVLENTEVVAEANCNIHGSAGSGKLTILVPDAKANPSAPDGTK